ncbi:MAG TPA: TlpA disulfide reductase family protein [Ilumatobacteraceae bacterium]|nr:TlpA disulfide reductase family protein [Ilumatobacteraceae bacterium]
MTTRFRLLVAGAAVAISVVGAVVWSRAAGSGPETDVVLDEPGVYVLPGLATNPPLPSDQLPDVDLRAVDGTAAALVPDGRPMVVNLWYSACPPCTRELADFAVVDAELGDRVRFVGVNPWDTAEKMVSFAADRGVTYELLRDDRGAFAEALDISSYPATLLVGADGTIVDVTGPIDDDDLRQRITELWP